MEDNWILVYGKSKESYLRRNDFRLEDLTGASMIAVDDKSSVIAVGILETTGDILRSSIVRRSPLEKQKLINGKLVFQIHILERRKARKLLKKLDG